MVLISRVGGDDKRGRAFFDAERLPGVPAQTRCLPAAVWQRGGFAQGVPFPDPYMAGQSLFWLLVEAKDSLVSQIPAYCRPERLPVGLRSLPGTSPAHLYGPPGSDQAL